MEAEPFCGKVPPDEARPVLPPLMQRRHLGSPIGKCIGVHEADAATGARHCLATGQGRDAAGISLPVPAISAQGYPSWTGAKTPSF